MNFPPSPPSWCPQGEHNKLKFDAHIDMSLTSLTGSVGDEPTQNCLLTGSAASHPLQESRATAWHSLVILERCLTLVAGTILAEDAHGMLNAKLADFGLHAIVEANDRNATVQKMCAACAPLLWLASLPTRSSAPAVVTATAPCCHVAAPSSCGCCRCLHMTPARRSI